MFEVGFSELLLIMVLGLVVLGPEKLPKLVSQVGRWMGRARAMARQFREQLEDEATLEPATRRPAAASPSHAEPAAAAAPAATPEPVSTPDPASAPEPAFDVAAAPAESPAAPRPADEPRGT